MTEQEAEALAERLTRIWTPETFKLRKETSHKWLYDAELGIDPSSGDHVYLEVVFGGMGTLLHWIYRLYDYPLFLA
ncbi:MAG: hypothetical protein EOP06_15755, partial [Proteobacteria bacterium]